jgi:hypothetical protein
MSAENSSDGPASVVIQCAYCEKATLGTKRGEYTVVPEGDDGWDPHRYILVGCQACKSAVLLVQEAEWGGGGWGDWGEPSLVWPDDSNKTLSIRIPQPIRRELIEAKACYKDKHYTAAAVMVRRTLEGVCVHQGKPNMPLFRALKELQEEEKLEGRLVQWAHELRGMGNQGAHFSMDPVGREDAQDGLALAEAIVDYLYVFTATYEEFKKRRSPQADEGGYEKEDGEGE